MGWTASLDRTMSKTRIGVVEHEAELVAAETPLKALYRSARIRLVANCFRESEQRHRRHRVLMDRIHLVRFDHPRAIGLIEPGPAAIRAAQLNQFVGEPTRVCCRVGRQTMTRRL